MRKTERDGSIHIYMNCITTDENKMLHQLIPLLQLDHIEVIGMRNTTINFVDADTTLYVYFIHNIDMRHSYSFCSLKLKRAKYVESKAMNTLTTKTITLQHIHTYIDTPNKYVSDNDDDNDDIHMYRIPMFQCM